MYSLLFLALVETHLFSDHKIHQPVIMTATNRLILYLVPITLLIINAALSWVYVHHIKTLRDAVRTWDAITPSVPNSNNYSRFVYKIYTHGDINLPIENYNRFCCP